MLEHMEKVQNCVSLVPEMMEKYLADDFDAAKVIFKKICHIEHEADEIKKELREHLPKAFMLPVARGDLLNYLKQQDNIADAAEDCGALAMLKHATLPKEMHEKLFRLINENLEAVEIASKITTGFNTLTETGFSETEVNNVLATIDSVEHKEWECDKVQMSFAKDLFAHEKQLGAVNLMLWFNIIRAISKMSNASESVGVQMRVMLARS